MIMRMKIILLWLASMALLLETGCVFVGFAGSPGCSTSSKVWTEVTEEFRIDTANITELQVQTHNGAIAHTGESAAGSTAVVLVTRKAGGATSVDADDALAAIQIVSEPAGGGVYRLGWKWSPPKRTGWGAKVSFEIQAPGGLGFDGETHNGRIEVVGVNADVKAVTHNGRIEVASEGNKLYAKTHNGRIVATYAGQDVTLLTHNGSVVADLSGCGHVMGSLIAHNGSVEVVLGEAASTRLSCETHNGRIEADVPLRDRKSTRRKLTGIVGNGGGDLHLRTHNGSIQIKKAAG